MRHITIRFVQTLLIIFVATALLTPVAEANGKGKGRGIGKEEKIAGT